MTVALSLCLALRARMDDPTLRRKFAKFLGPDRYRNFVRLTPRSPEETRLRFWQEKKWGRFLEDHPNAARSFEDIIKLFRVCVDHDCNLITDSDSAKRFCPVCNFVDAPFSLSAFEY